MKIPEELVEPAIKGVFEKEYKVIHKGDEYYSKDQVLKLLRMWNELYEHKCHESGTWANMATFRRCLLLDCLQAMETCDSDDGMNGPRQFYDDAKIEKSINEITVHLGAFKK